MGGLFFYIICWFYATLCSSATDFLPHLTEAADARWQSAGSTSDANVVFISIASVQHVADDAAWHPNTSSDFGL